MCNAHAEAIQNTWKNKTNAFDFNIESKRKIGYINSNENWGKTKLIFMCKIRLKTTKATHRNQKLVINLKECEIYWWIFSGIRARVFSSQEPGSKRGGSFSTPHFGTIYQIWWSYLAIKIQIVKKRFDSFRSKIPWNLKTNAMKNKNPTFSSQLIYHWNSLGKFKNFDGSMTGWTPSYFRIAKFDSFYNNSEDKLWILFKIFWNKLVRYLE